MNNDNDVKKGIYELYKRIIGQDIAFSFHCLFDHVRIFDNNKRIWNPWPQIIQIIISNISISHSLFLSLHDLFSPLFLSLSLTLPPILYTSISLPHTNTYQTLSSTIFFSYLFSLPSPFHIVFYSFPPTPITNPPCIISLRHSTVPVWGSTNAMC